MKVKENKQLVKLGKDASKGSSLKVYTPSTKSTNVKEGTRKANK